MAVLFFARFVKFYDVVCFFYYFKAMNLFVLLPNGCMYVLYV
jgi:hypothetical protein